MDRDLENFIMTRCEKALNENEEYMEMERSGKISQDILQSKAEVICYMKALEDIMALSRYSHKIKPLGFKIRNRLVAKMRK